MRSHVKSASSELWRIIEVGFKAVDPNNMTRREVVDCQLNDLALNIIHTAVGEKHMSHIELATTAKEAWDILTQEFVGNESMQRNRFEALSNQAEGFFMIDGEDHEEMYRRLKTLATQFRALGATYVDDAWIKRKYVSALWPFESTDLKSLQGRHNYHLMSSNEVMQEMAAYKVAAKNAEDARARAIGMHKGSSLALKAKVVVQDDDDETQEDVSHWDPKELEDTLKDYSALTSKVFWKSPSKARDFVNKASGRKEGGQRVRSCYNCQDKYHFVAECPFENREHHGGKLVRKDKSKDTHKKPFFKKNAINKKPPRIVLLAQEEYSSGEEEEEPTNEVAAIAIASSSSPSLFESPNENVSNSSARCFMAKTTEVSSPSSPKAMSNMDDATSLKIKEEIVAFDHFITNMQGETKKHVEALMSQYGEAQEMLEIKGKIEREDAMEIASLKDNLEEEHELRVSLEEQLESIEESNDLIVAKLIKERDHAIAKYKACKKEKVELGVGHSRLTEELEKLSKAHKALESEHSTLTKSYEQLQAQPSKNDVPSSSTPITCDHANIIEENARLKINLAKAISLGKKPFVTSQKGRVGLGFVEEEKKKESFMKDARAPQAKKANIPSAPQAKKANIPSAPQAKKVNIASGSATRGKTTSDDFAGKTNPYYIIFVDYYGDVYAKFVGPRNVPIARSIWVPKTLVANKRGPIEKWGPKSKQ